MVQGGWELVRQQMADRMAKAHITARMQRLAAGNFSDCKPHTNRCGNCASTTTRAIESTTPMRVNA